MSDEENGQDGGGSLTPREKADLHLEILGRKANEIRDGSGSDEDKVKQFKELAELFNTVVRNDPFADEDAADQQAATQEPQQAVGNAALNSHCYAQYQACGTSTFCQDQAAECPAQAALGREPLGD